MVQLDLLPDAQGKRTYRLTELHKTGPVYMADYASEATRAPEEAFRRLPGEEGIWILVFGDMVVFGLLFLTFSFYRAENVGLYRSGQDLLNEQLGLVNTLLLLTSSWAVALAVRNVRLGLRTQASTLLGIAVALGCSFVMIKIAEYHEKIAAGITLLTNDFFSYYFVITGIHLTHVLVGIGVLIFLILRTRRAALVVDDVRVFESGAIFWHLVDLLWLVIFALLYLTR